MTLARILFALLAHLDRAMEDTPPEEEALVGDAFPKNVEIVLDAAGRAMDKGTGKYLRALPNSECEHSTLIGLGGLEGGFWTVDADGDLAEWEPPCGWLIH